jgi:hypothetical protein
MSAGNGNDRDAAPAGLVSTPTSVTLCKFSLTYERTGNSVVECQRPAAYALVYALFWDSDFN